MRLHWREAGDPAHPAVVWVHGGSVEQFFGPHFPNRSHRGLVHALIGDFFRSLGI